MDSRTFYGTKSRQDDSSESNDSDFDYEPQDNETLSEISSDDELSAEETLLDETEGSCHLSTEVSGQLSTEGCSQIASEGSSQSSSKCSNNWTNVVSSSRAFSFTSNENIQYQLNSEDDAVTPFDVYKVFVSDEIIEMIVKETNRYYEECMTETQVTMHSKLKYWKTVTAKDIEQMFGVPMLKG